MRKGFRGLQYEEAKLTRIRHVVFFMHTGSYKHKGLAQAQQLTFVVATSKIRNKNSNDFENLEQLCVTDTDEIFPNPKL